MSRGARCSSRLLRIGCASDAPDSRWENPVREPVDTAVLSHTDAASSRLWAESSHHRLTHRIAGPFVRQPRRISAARRGAERTRPRCSFEAQAAVERMPRWLLPIAHCSTRGLATSGAPGQAKAKAGGSNRGHRPGSAPRLKCCVRLAGRRRALRRSRAVRAMPPEAKVDALAGGAALHAAATAMFTTNVRRRCSARDVMPVARAHAA
jgi:hypothetical protein